VRSTVAIEAGTYFWSDLSFQKEKEKEKEKIL
jgi:hypothetical protein